MGSIRKFGGYFRALASTEVQAPFFTLLELVSRWPDLWLKGSHSPRAVKFPLLILPHSRFAFDRFLFHFILWYPTLLAILPEWRKRSFPSLQDSRSDLKSLNSMLQQFLMVLAPPALPFSVLSWALHIVRISLLLGFPLYQHRLELYYS